MTASEKLKKFFGIEKFSTYVDEHFEHSNIRASIYLSSVIIFLELMMIVSAVVRHLTGVAPRTTVWFVNHLSSYFVLLLAGIVMLVYAIMYEHSKAKVRKGSFVINSIFSFISIAFGIYISYLDYIKGEQFITLITMMIFVFCFVIWRPVYTIIFLTTTFSFFLYLCNKAVPVTYATKVNLFIIWIALLMSAINSYRQKIRDAYRDEKLEKANELLVKLSINDEVTGIANMNYFRGQVLSLLRSPAVDISHKIFLFLDIEHFKLYNEKYGFLEGNNFLKRFAEKVSEVFSSSVAAHFSNDNFVIFADDFEVSEKLKVLQNEIKNPKYEIKMALKTGACRPDSRDCLPIIACDRARQACDSIKKHYGVDYCEYDEMMARKIELKHYIINNIDSAIEKKYIKVYYQPVVDSNTGALCGAEALARWDDPKYGFLSPEDFIQTLEEYRQIHKLDMHMVRKVCEDLNICRKKLGHLVPVSINFSRIDFEYLNLTEEVGKLLEEFDIEKHWIHIEITESALTENDKTLQHSLKSLRDSGYALWLDDFGSGYSGLNVLKEYDFDVMKIDMKFLDNFEKNEKAKTLLKNIITLAEQLGMQTLTEGVETEEAEVFLKEIGCQKLQGFRFGKPMAIDTLEQKINLGEFKII